MVLNSEIPDVVTPMRPGFQEAYSLLRGLEEKLRMLIEQSLSRLSEKWWKERIPDDVRQQAEDRKRRNDMLWPWMVGANLHPIHYVDFSDYVKIILRRDNWREVFALIFRDNEIVSAKLPELEPIRNALAHSHSLPKNGLQTVENSEQ